MKATVGRIVHFYSEAIANKNPANPGYGLNGQGAGPYAATVQQVIPGGEYVNLKVIGWGVDAWDEGSVSELPEGVDGSVLGRFWQWPPREVEMLSVTGEAIDPKTGEALPLSNAVAAISV